jgi:uncharacterized membrane protein SirB2
VRWSLRVLPSLLSSLINFRGFILLAILKKSCMQRSANWIQELLPILVVALSFSILLSVRNCCTWLKASRALGLC